MSCLWKVLNMKCPIYEFLFLWNVLFMKCPIYEIYCLWNVLSMKYTVYEMSCLWNLLSMKCPVYEIYCLWNVLSMKFTVYEIYCLWNLLSMKFTVYEMSCLWNVLSMKCPVYEIYCLWNILSMKWSINEMSNCEMSVYEMTQHHMMYLEKTKDVMQGKLFHCTHLLYCSVLSLGGNVNTRRMLQPDMVSIFHIKKINEIFCSLESVMWIIKIIKFNAFNLLGY